MRKKQWSNPGVVAALSAALLFGAGTPFAKLLLSSVNPWLLAGLLYIGSGIGLTMYRSFNKASIVKLQRSESLWFAGAIMAGGVIAPVLLMFGLAQTPASGASLLLSVEGVFTALLAWFAFKENFDRRMILGMLAIVAGALVLGWQGSASFAGIWPTLALLGACLAWGIDNNLTRKVSLTDTTWIAAVKGLAAGVVNLALAFLLGVSWPPLPNIFGAMVIGFFSYGVSQALFVVGLHRLGTARTGAYFSIAPFIGTVIAILFGEPVTIPLIVAGVFMAVGIWLHLTEHHEHQHIHRELEHEHEHTHDGHHQHIHELPGVNSHTHRHRHAVLSHRHEHFPDAHHQHDHPER